MKNLFVFLCVAALLTGSLVGCNRDEPKPAPTSTPNAVMTPDSMPNPADGVVEDDDGIITGKDSTGN